MNDALSAVDPSPTVEVHYKGNLTSPLGLPTLPTPLLTCMEVVHLLSRQ